MNIGEVYYCSRCMKVIETEDICPYCGHDHYGAVSNHVLAEGTLLHDGRYQLGAVVGQGGFGITYAAWDLVLGMPVAIKEYFPQSSAERDIGESDDVHVKPDAQYVHELGLRTFIRESRILATLQNIKTVVTVYDCFEENQTFYIVMEYVHGTTLHDYCQNTRISPQKLLKLMRGVIDDLIRVHHSGVLHRDISPYNFLVQEDGTVKLIDFGASVNLNTADHKNFSLNQSFAAPEQFEVHGEQGAWTDVYSLAVTLYALISGQMPPDALSRTGQDPLKRSSFRNLFVSRRLKKAIKHGACLDIRKRTASMEEFRAELYHLPKPLITGKQKFLYSLKIIFIVVGMGAICLGIIFLDDIRFGEQVQLKAEAYLKNNADAAYTLANNYRKGRYGEEEFFHHEKRAAYWYQWAAEHGNINAMFDYAYLLHKGPLAERNIPLAMDYYQKCVELGSDMALNNLGTIYLEGAYVEQDTERAYEYFCKAAEQNNTLAMVNLGDIYRVGIGCEPDENKAFSFYQTASELGDPLGTYKVACCYGDGIGVEKDDLKYFSLCLEAAQDGCVEAQCHMGRFYQYGELGFKNENTALSWYLDAMCYESGSAEAYYQTAVLYRDGIDGETDESKALSYMEKAAEMGHAKAQQELADLERRTMK